MRKLNDLNHDERPFIGKVSPTMGGAYSAGQTYAALTFVENDGSLYISLQTAYGIEPGVSANWEQYWMLCASRGEKGDTGDGLTMTPCKRYNRRFRIQPQEMRTASERPQPSA